MQLLAVIELFPTRTLGAFCVAFGVACVAVAVGCILSEQLQRWASGLASKFLALSPLNKAVLVLALAVSTVCAQKSGTNEVDRIGVEGEGQGEGEQWNLPTCSAGQPEQESNLLCSPSPSYFDYSCQTVTPDDIARGWQPWETRTNGTDFTMPANAVRNADWFRFGGHSMFDFVSFGEGWTFPYGTQELARVTAMEDGGLRVKLSRSEDEIRAVPCPLAALPRQSQFWHTTNGADRVFVWRDFFADGDTGAVVSASVELRGNGDFVTRSNAVETLCRRIEPFDWDGDGLPNDKDESPYAYDGDCYGQSDEWVRANFTNAEEILSVGYPQWVDAQVGVGLENGLYKLTATFPEVPRRTTLLTVGGVSVCVTNAGEYVFLLGKGVYYGLALSSACGAEFSAVDDIAPRRMMAGGAGAPGETETGGHWTIDYSWIDLVVPNPLVPMAPAAHIVWYPELTVSPVTWEPHRGQPNESFSARLRDVPWFVRPSYSWHTSDEEIVAISNATARTAQFFCREFGERFWNAELRLEVTLPGATVRSYFVPDAHDPRERITLEINMPETYFVDNDDDDGDGRPDCGTFCDGNGDSVYNDELDLGAIAFSSLVPTSGAVRVESINDLRCNVALDAYDGARVTAGMEWGVSDGRALTKSLFLTPIAVSPRFESDGIKLRWVPQPEGYEQTARRRFTVVNPEAEPICTNWTEFVQDGVTVRRVVNPCGVAVGSDAVFRIRINPADYPDSRIVWGATTDYGAVSFPEGNVGREVRIRGETPGLVRLRVQVGDCRAEKPGFDLRVVQPKTVKLSAWIIANKGVLPRTVNEVREMVAVANDIYSQVGVTLDIGDRIVVTNIPAAYDVLWEGTTNTMWNFDQLADIASGTGGLEVYFVNKIIDSSGAGGRETLGGHSDSGIVVAADGNGATLAHEVGHAFGMKDVYHVNHDGRSIMGFTRQRFQPCDWNNGSAAEGEGGERFYASGTLHYKVIGRMLMEGHESKSATSGVDITHGSVYGFDVADVEGNVETGYFQNPWHVDNPVHR